MATLDHPDAVEGPSSCVVYREEPEPGKVRARRRFGVATLPVVLPSVTAPVDDLPSTSMMSDLPDVPRAGVSRLAYSPCGQYLATVEDLLGSTVWIWSTKSYRLVSTLVLTDRLSDWMWTGGRPAPVRRGPGGSTPAALPKGPMLPSLLACLTGNSRVYLWSSEGASVVQIPLEKFKARMGKGGETAAGHVLCLNDYRMFACAYMEENT